LKLRRDEPLSNFPFNFNSRRYNEADEKMNGHRTALIKTDPEYFGFVG